jgi:AcrR family transcriptional regulator
MSRARVRPTRDETRSRLFEAAAEVFAEYGVGAATVEQIASAAGFTRGAFYSNFETKDDLLIAMLEDHVQRSITHNLDLLAKHPDTVSFVEALSDDAGREHDPLHSSPLLQMELILHVARTPEHRPALAERLRTMRTLIGEIVVSTLRAAGIEREIDAQDAGALLLAIEDGLRLHRLIDPTSTPPDAFLEAVRGLQALMLATRDA